MKFCLFSKGRKKQTIPSRYTLRVNGLITPLTEISTHEQGSICPNKDVTGISRKLILNPSDAKATFVHSTRTQKIFEKPSRPCHVGIHWINPAKHSQMSTYMPGFRSFFSFFASFCVGKIGHQQHKGL